MSPLVPGERPGPRLLGVVAVATLLVTAGCGGVFGGDGATPTAAPTSTAAPPDGTDSTAPPTVDDTTEVEGQTEPPFPADRLPPGVETDGSVDLGRLTEAHRNSLDGAAFTLGLNLSRRLVAADGNTTRIDAVQRARTDGSQYLTTFRQEGRFVLAQTTWGNDSVAVARVDTGDGVRYQRAQPDVVQGNLSGVRFARQFAENATYTVAVVGEDRVVLTADSAAPGLAGQIGTTVTNVTSYDGRLVVDQEGRIRQFDAVVAVELQGGTGTVDATMRLSAVGTTTVERPGWVSEALSGSGVGGRLVAPGACAGRCPGD
jgi:hypothetical protein